MSNSSGFVRSKQALKNHDLKVTKSVKRFDYLKKNQKPRFAFAVVPAVDGYDPQPTAYHRHIAQIDIKNSTYDVSAQCIGQGCPACTAAFRQYKETPYAKRGKEWYKVDKKKSLSHFFLVYEVVLNSDNSVKINDDAAPEILEYRYNRNGDCPDWENFMDAYEDAIAKGLDPQDPHAAAVFEVTQQEEKVIGGDMMRIAYKHRAMDETVSIPENYLEDLTSRVKLNDLYIKLDREDLDLIIATDSDAKRSSSQDESGNKSVQAEVEKAYTQVKSPDFQRILEFFLNKDDASGTSQSQGSIADQVRKSTYSQPASEDMTKSVAAPQSTEGESSGGSEAPLSDQAKEQKTQSARERIIAIKNKRKQSQA